MKTLWALCMACMLGACGFHLKGTHSSIQTTLPSQTWQVEGGELQTSLEQLIQLNGGKVTPQAATQIKLIVVEHKKDIYTITRAAKLNEYLLSLRVVAQAYKNGQPWGEAFEIYTSRTLPYSDSLILGKQEEEQMIWKEIRDDVSEQIIRKLAFLPS